MSEKYPIPEIPNGFVIMLAGNIGISQNLDAEECNKLKIIK